MDEKPEFMNTYFRQSFLLSILNEINTKIFDKRFHSKCDISYCSITDNDIKKIKKALLRISVDDKDINDLIIMLDDFEDNIANISRLSNKIKNRINDIVFVSVCKPKGL